VHVSVIGGAFNPAVGIGLPLVKGEHIGDIWIYVLGPISGAIVSSYCMAYWANDLKRPARDDQQLLDTNYSVLHDSAE
jgi:hypothetical protein